LVEELLQPTQLNTNDPGLEGLLPALKRLDRLIERAVTAVSAVCGAEAAADPFRGLHISRREAEHLLAREPGAPMFPADETQAHSDLPGLALSDDSRLARLAATFGLSAFECDLILIALAPEFDLRYERLYAYLQNDVSRRRPSIDMALNLLCPSAEARLARRAHFAIDAPLIRHGLIHLLPDPDQAEPPLLAHILKLDEQIADILLGQAGLDRRLASFCRLVTPQAGPGDLPLDAAARRGVLALIVQAVVKHQPLRLHFQGPPGSGRRKAAEVLAGAVERRLLCADLARAATTETGFDSALKLLFREARFLDAILFIEGVDELRGEPPSSSYRTLVRALGESSGVVLLAGARAWTPVGPESLGVIPIAFSIPAFRQRRQCWQAALAAGGLTLDPADLDALADRFRLTPIQIADAVVIARAYACRRTVRSPGEPAFPIDDRPSLDDLFAAARAQTGHDLAALAHKVEPRYTWGDIVLPEDALAQLREICQRVAHRQRVLGEWGFDRKLSMGKGANALFAGPSGTGKTMAAEIIANTLGLDLYKIDLSGVVSKYIGETEKNLDRIFTAAENANAILFFDEADALFGKRSEVRDSHDRYANIEISYLLQKIEQYTGVAILASNLRQNLDEAFVRRLSFTIHFPFPDEASRRRIWAGMWPGETPVSETVDLDFMARQFKLSGGNIKNITLAAAFLAASDGDVVTMPHMLRATRREYQKLGKHLSESELGFQRPIRSVA
jgi:AAA+ superfamily predicted ATPase